MAAKYTVNLPNGGYASANSLEGFKTIMRAEPGAKEYRLTAEIALTDGWHFVKVEYPPGMTQADVQRVAAALSGLCLPEGVQPFSFEAEEPPAQVAAGR